MHAILNVSVTKCPFAPFQGRIINRLRRMRTIKVAKCLSNLLYSSAKYYPGPNLMASVPFFIETRPEGDKNHLRLIRKQKGKTARLQQTDSVKPFIAHVCLEPDDPTGEW